MRPPEWIVAWQSAGRFQKYVSAAGGDLARGLQLYQWNARLAAAFLCDLGHLEIGLRNAYDSAIRTHIDLDGRDWLSVDGALVAFPPHHVRDKRNRWVDKNDHPRWKLKGARTRAGTDRGAPRGKVIAELDFGFWSYLTSDIHEKPLWVPALHHAFAPGTDRARLHATLSELRDLRNRIAHHESVFDRDPERHRRRTLFVAGLLSAELRGFIADHSDLPQLTHARP